MAKVRKPAPTTHVLRADEGEWQPLLPGIHIKTLRRDAARARRPRCGASSRAQAFRAHPHSHEEECLVIEGSIIQDGIEYFPGDYLLAEAGCSTRPSIRRAARCS